MTRTVRPFFTILPFTALLTASGLTGLTTARVPLTEAPFLSGGYQRAYEDAFTDSVPLKELAQHTYTAILIGLFQQSGPEVVLADRDWVFTAEEMREPGAAFDLETELETARASLDAQGITLLPVIIPDKARVYADLLPRRRSAAIEARYEDALALLSDLGFPSVDLETVLTDGRATAPTFMRTDTHWSPHGADLAAHALASATGLLATTEAEFQTTDQAAMPFHGDLRPFVETGVFGPWIGPAPEQIEVPVTTAADTGAGLFGEARIDAILVGTSFSARSDFNFAGFLQEATNLSVVNLAVEGQGPFLPMRDVLASDAITDLNPTIVFWEIPERYIHSRSFQ